jgi:hypothetical protein
MRGHRQRPRFERRHQWQCCARCNRWGDLMQHWRPPTRCSVHRWRWHRPWRRRRLTERHLECSTSTVEHAGGRRPWIGQLRSAPTRRRHTNPRGRPGCGHQRGGRPRPNRRESSTGLSRPAASSAYGHHRELRQIACQARGTIRVHSWGWDEGRGGVHQVYDSGHAGLPCISTHLFSDEGDVHSSHWPNSSDADRDSPARGRARF